MAIPNVTPYSGQKPIPGQDQPTFNQNMSDELDYFNALPAELNPAINAMNQTATDVDNAKTAAEAAASEAENSAVKAYLAADAAGYKGEWYAGAPVELGDIWGYEGSEWRSLTGADVEPVEGLDWRSINDHSNLTNRDESGAHPASAITGVIELFRRSYAEAGYNLVHGSFEAGGEIVNNNDVLLQESTGKAYSGTAGIIPAGTDPEDDNFIDISGVMLRNSVGAYLEDFGAAGDGTIDRETGLVTGTDSTLAVKTAVAWLNSLNSVDPESGGTYGFKLLGSPGAAYVVKGNNILGNQRAEAGETQQLASSFYFDGNGCTFLWEPQSFDDSWIDYAATYYRPETINYRILVTGEVNARAFLRTNAQSFGNVFQEGKFDDVVCMAGSDPSGYRWRSGNYMETVFDIDGDILQDRCMCRRSKFQQFKRMFRSEAPEAVGWVLDGTSFWTWVDGANYIELNKTFSGSHTHVACDIVFFGDNSKLIYANASNYDSYKNNGEIYVIAPRVETKSGKQFTAVWANHGKIVVDGLNCRNGNSDFNAQSNYVSCEIYNDAMVNFRNCVLPSRSRMMFTSKAELDKFPLFSNSYGAVFDNCEFQNYRFIPEYVSITGSITTYRDVIQAGLYARASKVSGSKSGNGAYGNTLLQDNCLQVIPLNTDNVGGNSWIDNGILTRLPDNCVIEELVLYVPENSDITKFDVIVANQPVKTINTTVGVKNKLRVVGDTDWGISAPLGGTVRIQPYIGSDATPRMTGFGYMKVRGAVSLQDITSNDTPKII